MQTMSLPTPSHCSGGSASGRMARRWLSTRLFSASSRWPSSVCSPPLPAALTEPSRRLPAPS